MMMMTYPLLTSCTCETTHTRVLHGSIKHVTHDGREDRSLRDTARLLKQHRSYLHEVVVQVLFQQSNQRVSFQVLINHQVVDNCSVKFRSNRRGE